MKVSFKSKFNSSRLDTYAKVSSEFGNRIKNISNLEEDLPIFLDTNILLKAYEISFASREKLFNFFQTNKEKIILSDQVQKEFISNRQEIIEKFEHKTTKQLKVDFESNVLNKIQHFLNENKTILVDHPDFAKKLDDTKKDLTESAHNSFDEGKIKTFDSFNDYFLNLYKEFTLLKLDEECHKLLIQDFKELSKTVPPDKIRDYLQKKSRNAFPGIGDLKEKSDSASGDFIIFHELMNYARENKKDVIFLTYDNSKGDWFDLNKKPLIHYLENFYLNTKQHLFILDANRFFKQNLNTDFKSITEAKRLVIDHIGPSSLKFLFMKYLPSIPVDISRSDTLKLKREFRFNGIEDSLKPIKKVLNSETLKNNYNYFLELINDLEIGSIDIIRLLMYAEYENYKFAKRLDDYSIVIDEDCFKDIHLF